MKKATFGWLFSWCAGFTTLVAQGKLETQCWGGFQVVLTHRSKSFFAPKPIVMGGGNRND
jgi:hypothetical protein